MVEEGGFEPPKLQATDLQSAPFGHSGTLPYNIKLKWSWGWDSNPRRADYKSAALPTELRQHRFSNGLNYSIIFLPCQLLFLFFIFFMKRKKQSKRNFAPFWSGLRDLNPRPHGPKPCALPNCAKPRFFAVSIIARIHHLRKVNISSFFVIFLNCLLFSLIFFQFERFTYISLQKTLKCRIKAEDRKCQMPYTEHAPIRQTVRAMQKMPEHKVR